MSMARCDRCRGLIDTDAHPEACIEDGYLCEDCAGWSLEDELAMRADEQNDEAWLEARV